MTKDTGNSKFSSLLSRFRSMTARHPQERVWPELVKILESYPTDDAPPRPLRQDSELGCLILAKAYKAPEPELLHIYKEGLGRCGQAGGVFLAGLVLHALGCAPEEDKGPDPEALLREIPRQQLPDVLDALLRTPDDIPASLLRAAIKVLDSALMDQDAPFGLYLERQARTVDGPAFALADALRPSDRVNQAHQDLDAAVVAAKTGDPGPDGLGAALDMLLAVQAPGLAARLVPVMASKHVPSLMAAMKALRRTAPKGHSRLAQLVGKLLLHAEEAVRLAALDLLLALGGGDAGRIIAAAFKKEQGLRDHIAARAPVMDRQVYESFMSGLPAKAAPGIRAAIFSALAAAAPRAARECLALADPAGSDARKALETRTAMPAAPARYDEDAVVGAFEKRLQKAKKPAQPQKKDKGSIFSRLGGGASQDDAGVQFGMDMNFQDKDASGRKMSSPIYEGQPVNGLKFKDTFLDGAVFHNCTLTEVDFTDAVLRNARFENCVLDGCNFSDAALYRCDFFDVRMRGCTLCGTTMAGVRMRLVDAKGVSMAEAGLHGCSVDCCRFTGSDFSGIEIMSCELTGVEFLAGLMAGADLSDSTLLCCRALGLRAMDCRASGLVTDNHFFMDMEKASLNRRCREDAAGAVSWAKPDPAQAELAHKALEHWYSLNAMRAQWRDFLANNARREAWCQGKLGQEKSQFYRLAPFLIHSDVFEKHDPEVPPLPLSVRMDAYHPDYTTLEIARRHFPQAVLPRKEPDPVRIEALFTIGSVGTMAQTEKSDLDYWVCYDPEDMPDILVDGLAYKLEAIETWADQRFGLEVHFFTMDTTLIQSNTFGVSDSESSGTAQAMLLKEEFYRTAVGVAGKTPLWWLTPLGAGDEDCARAMETLSQIEDGKRIIDLGNLVAIPPEEFFGASLWQIVKALKSPFKSIMKFGLLEKYIAGEETGTGLLCDHLKINLDRGDRSLAHTDPYALLFQEVSNHYIHTRDKESLQLVRLSFLLKTKLDDLSAVSGIHVRPQERELEAIFSSRRGLAGLTLAGGSVGRDWPIEKLAAVGAMVNKFIVRTYTRVRDSRTGKGGIAITPEDITKLGRKISSTFSKRRHKVEHIPILAMAGSSFKVLHFNAFGKKMGSPTDWECKGAQAVSTSHRLHLSTLRKGKNLAQMLIWLASNSIYSPRMDVKGDYSISPVSAKDLKSLLDTMCAFFPPSATFNTDVGETLNPERIVKVLFVLNLTKPREQNQILETSIIYSTNWGELFCRTLPVTSTDLVANPLEFLNNNVEQAVNEQPEMGCFVPERSMCPKPAL